MKVLDIFCGVGGLAQGFVKSGFDVIGIDISEPAGKTFELNNRSKFVKADLSRELIEGNYDVVVGGPPCKPWSSINVTRRGKSHSDYKLLSRFFKHVEHHIPEIFLLENVPPLQHDPTYRRFIRRLRKKNYSIAIKKINYNDYGAPTRRHRLITVGIRNGNADVFFNRLSELERKPRTVRDVMWALRRKEMGKVPDHVWPRLKTILKYRKYYESGKYGWYILKWNEAAPSFGNVMKTYILHPDAFDGGALRVISVKEALLIMGFDQKFSFPKDIGMGLKYQMIADSVSPAFSSAAAKTMKEILSNGGS